MKTERNTAKQDRNRSLHAVTNRNTITFDFEKMAWAGIHLYQIKLWERLYPDVDIARILKVDIPQWLDRQVLSREPLKISIKGRKRNWKTFIAKWLQREQERRAFG